ncbi:hypothetical protein [Puia dinghuensis]|nr:hypothetical protein [Puia dinghuensis]
MKQKKELRKRILVVHLTPSEYADLREKFTSTTYRVFSDYIRGLLHREPIIKKYRNQSLDQFELTAIGIKQQLEALRHSFSARVQQLRSLHPGTISQETLEFLLAAEFELRDNITAIKATLVNIYELCSQKQNPSAK